jgi:glutaminyl-peptide cyclotransferase
MQQKDMPQHHKLSRRHFLSSLFVFLGGCASAPRTSADHIVFPTPSASSSPSPTSTPMPLHFSGARALDHAAAQMQYVPRHTGTEGWQKCGDYILEQFAAQGWATEEQPFTYMNPPCRNMIAKRGDGPILILGAHYDSRKYADQDPDPAKRSDPVPAANDGASGVAVLIELARVMKPETLQRAIWFVAFDAEDNGDIDGWDWIAGSRHFVSALTVVPQGMVLFDMIGDADQQIFYEQNSHVEMNTSLWNIAAELDYPAFVSRYRHSMLDDHIPFIRQGIPSVDMIDFDYPYWHTTADTLDKISAASLEAVGRTIEEWILRGTPGLPAPESCLNQEQPSLCYHGCKIGATERVNTRKYF